MADPRLKALENLAAKAGAANSEELGAFDKLLQYADTPGRMTRAGIGALQGDGDVLDAIRGQVGVGGPEAPSGFDIASKFGDQYGIENPYALTAIATAADVLDPTMLIPGGAVGKVAAPVAKMAGKGKTAAKALEAAEPSRFGRLAQVLKETKPEGMGKVKVLDDAPKPTNWQIGPETVSPVSLPEPKVERTIESLFGREQAEELLSQFPEIGRTITVPKKSLK